METTTANEIEKFSFRIDFLSLSSMKITKKKYKRYTMHRNFMWRIGIGSSSIIIWTEHRHITPVGLEFIHHLCGGIHSSHHHQSLNLLLCLLCWANRTEPNRTSFKIRELKESRNGNVVKSWSNQNPFESQQIDFDVVFSPFLWCFFSKFLEVVLKTLFLKLEGLLGRFFLKK